MEMVHVGHVSGGEWRLGGKGEKKPKGTFWAKARR